MTKALRWSTLLTLIVTCSCAGQTDRLGVIALERPAEASPRGEVGDQSRASPATTPQAKITAVATMGDRGVVSVQFAVRYMGITGEGVSVYNPGDAGYDGIL